MRLVDWIAQKGDGSLTRLARDADVAYTTVFHAKEGKPIKTYETARRISEATGGEVSIAELCEADHGDSASTEPTEGAA